MTAYMPNPPNPDVDPQHIHIQPMPGFNPTLNQCIQSNYGTIVQTVPQTVVFIGSCPACHV